MIPAIAFILKYKTGLAYAAIAVFIAGLLIVHKLDSATIATCQAERAAIVQMTEQFKASALAATKRLSDQQAKHGRIINRNLRDIKNAPESSNAPLSPVLGDALAGLCNTGAAGCAAK